MLEVKLTIEFICKLYEKKKKKKKYENLVPLLLKLTVAVSLNLDIS